MSDRKGISRRAAVGTMALATVGLVADRGLAANDRKIPRRRKRGVRKVNRETLEEMFWQNAVGADFVVQDYCWLESSERPEAACLQLSSVERFQPDSDDARPKNIRHCAIFLEFECRKELKLQPASYQLAHPTFGEFDLLLSKKTSKSGVDYYEAVLN